jgi:hypothetical protein
LDHSTTFLAHLLEGVAEPGLDGGQFDWLRVAFLDEFSV